MFIVIELHGGPEYATICMNENGENLVFDDYESAKEYSENCQDPLIVAVC